MKPAHEIHIGERLRIGDERMTVIDVSIIEYRSVVVVEVEDIPGARSFWEFRYGEMVDA